MEEKIITTETREKIKGYLEGFIQGLIDEHRSDVARKKIREDHDAYLSPGGIFKPFHESIIPPEVIRVSSFERSFSTKLGGTFEECARLIALQKYHGVARNYSIKETISSALLQKIEQMRGNISTGKGVDFLALIDGLLNSKYDDDPQEERLIVADLYFKKDEIEYFFEIKSPKPNKGQCLEVTERLLQIHAAKKKKRPDIYAYFAMPYNPYGTKKSQYKHSFSRKYLDMKEEVLLGSEFWDFIGGKGTYDELLEIYAEVGKENGKKIIDALAFGF